MVAIAYAHKIMHIVHQDPMDILVLAPVFHQYQLLIAQEAQTTKLLVMETLQLAHVVHLVFLLVGQEFALEHIV